MSQIHISHRGGENVDGIRISVACEEANIMAMVNVAHDVNLESESGHDVLLFSERVWSGNFLSCADGRL